MPDREDSVDDLQERTRAIVETIVDGVITIDQHGIIESVNPAAQRIFGYPAEAMLGRNVSMLMPEPYRGEHDGYIHNFLETGVRKIIGVGREVQGLRADGESFPMHLAVSEMSVQGERKFTGIVRDISESKQYAQSLRDSEARHRVIFENIVDGIITIDEKGIIDTVNPAVEKIFGYSEAEMKGCNVKMLMPPPFHDEHDGYISNYLNTGKKKIIGIGREVTGLRKDGNSFPMELAVSEMQVDGKRMFTGILRDITERKETEAELQRITQRMREQKMKDEFISTVSHELRTPLTSIRGSLGLMLGNAVGELPEQARNLLEIAHKNSERLLLLINDILDISKIESGKMQFQYEELEIKPFIENAIESNKAYADEHGVSFVLTDCVEEAWVIGDANRLMQVMSNLMSNAAKFAPSGSQVEISAVRKKHLVRVAVKDSGPGIPREFQERIFDKFTQADSSDTRQMGGTGLGLNISKAIVEKHGGRISFATEAGVGTTFYFDLPELVPTAIGDVDALVEGDEYRHQVRDAERILILEDDKDVAALLRLMLAQAGYETDTAYTAKQAYQRLHQPGADYAAMTLDIMLPDKDGISFYEELRANPLTIDLPIVVVSAKADQIEKRIKANALSIVDWLQKPIDQERLLRSIRTCVKRHHGPAHVLHVEDDRDIAEIIRMLLADHAKVLNVRTLSDAKERLLREKYDLVLLDIGLPDGSGLELIDIINGMDQPPHLVVFSAGHLASEHLAGVDMALTKSQLSNPELVNRIVSVLESDAPTRDRQE